jgi:SAM-dependent methyltransferase
LPYVLLGENAERCYAKPRGHAGDFLTIARLYENQPRGCGRVGPILDACFMNLAAVRAVRNRRALLAREIRAAIDGSPDKPARVASLACGPATELFDVYRELADPTRLRSTLLDLDFQALAYVADRRDRCDFKHHMTLLHDNLIHLAVGKGHASLGDQDLVYSVGLIDYFQDDFVVRLLNYVHRTLREGGRVLLGNFHPRNATRALLDHVFEWRLVHRTEEDMNRLFAASAFGQPCSRILFEDEGINLFAECHKG